MAWIKLDQSLCKHRKVMCMSDMLDEQDAHIIGHLSLLWIWCLDNAPTGVLPSSNRIISRAAQYLGDADSFFSALETSGLVDINEDGSRSIHDWFDFAGSLIDKRVANRDRMRSARATHNNSTCSKRTGARVEKSRVEKNKEKQEKDASDKPTDLFSEFWQLYPKKVSKPRALKDFSDQKITQVDMDVIVTQIRDIGNLTAEERKKIPAANIYLKERRWEGNAPFVGLDIYREQARNASLNGSQTVQINGSNPEQPRPKSPIVHPDTHEQLPTIFDAINRAYMVARDKQTGEVLYKYASLDWRPTHPRDNPAESKWREKPNGKPIPLADVIRRAESNRV